MSNLEGRALLLLKRLEARKNLKSRAGILLSGVSKYNFIEKKLKKNGKKLGRDYFINKLITLRKMTRNFRDAHK